MTSSSALALIEQLRERISSRDREQVEARPPLQRAGVLVPLFVLGGGLSLLFTRRTDTVLTHKGQISFPGGAEEPGDQGLVETALRESYEEIGLEPGRVELLGQLDDAFTAVSGFVVSPVVGLVSGDPQDLRPAPTEVRSLLLVPMETLKDPSLHREEVRTWEGMGYTIHYYTVGDDVIWGLTGRILYQLLSLIPDQRS
jgi:8-oxo-dGTP pyrophosphatase MutT (NUDIX family)